MDECVTSMKEAIALLDVMDKSISSDVAPSNSELSSLIENYASKLSNMHKMSQSTSAILQGELPLEFLHQMDQDFVSPDLFHQRLIDEKKAEIGKIGERNYFIKELVTQVKAEAASTS